MSSASSMPGFCPATAIFHNTGVQQLAASLTFSGKIVQLKADCGARENSLQTGYRSNASEPTFCKFFRESCAATSSEGHKMYRVLCNGLHFRIVETVIFAVARLFFTSHLRPVLGKTHGGNSASKSENPASRNWWACISLVIGLVLFRLVSVPVCELNVWNQINPCRKRIS